MCYNTGQHHTHYSAQDPSANAEYEFGHTETGEPGRFHNSVTQAVEKKSVTRTQDDEYLKTGFPSTNNPFTLCPEGTGCIEILSHNDTKPSKHSIIFKQVSDLSSIHTRFPGIKANSCFPSFIPKGKEEGMTGTGYSDTNIKKRPLRNVKPALKLMANIMLKESGTILGKKPLSKATGEHHSRSMTK